MEKSTRGLGSERSIQPADGRHFLHIVDHFALALGKVGATGYFWSLTLEDRFYFSVSGSSCWWCEGPVALENLLLLIACRHCQPLVYRRLPSLLWVTRLDALMGDC